MLSIIIIIVQYNNDTMSSSILLIIHQIIFLKDFLVLFNLIYIGMYYLTP